MQLFGSYFHTGNFSVQTIYIFLEIKVLFRLNFIKVSIIFNMADTLIHNIRTHSPFNYLKSYIWEKVRLRGLLDYSMFVSVTSKTTLVLFSHVTPTSFPRPSLSPKENDMALGTRSMSLALPAIIYIKLIWISIKKVLNDITLCWNKHFVCFRRMGLVGFIISCYLRGLLDVKVIKKILKL